jgi:transcriptional regulator with PAS, ATPase and Fis domain
MNVSSLNGFERISEKEIVGNSKVMKDMLSLVDRVARTDTNVMIMGESGTGKELVGRKIHCNSDRKEGPYFIVNCGALQDTLLESELFGHMKGAFNGAISEKTGLIERANNGTIFLDEVSELNPMMQTKVLRFLQEGEAYKVGSTTSFKSNVRIISATNKDVKKEVDEGRFREDFYYRLNTISIHTSSLKNRVDDIPLLANYFLKMHNSDRIHKSFTPGAIKVLCEYVWPGNVRELQNVVERANIMCDGQFIEAIHLPEHIRIKKEAEQEVKVYREMTLEALEREHICNTLVHLKGNKTKTARVLGITVKTLYNKLHSYGMIQPQSEKQV